MLPPETQVELYGQEIDGEVVQVTFPDLLDEGPGNWREFPAALLASYCDDQNINVYSYKQTNLEFADS